MDQNERAALIAQLVRDYGGLRVPGRPGLPYPGYEEPGTAGRAKIGAFNQAAGAAGGLPMSRGFPLNSPLGKIYLEAVQKAYEYENEMKRLTGRAGQVPYPPENEMGAFPAVWPHNFKGAFE